MYCVTEFIHTTRFTSRLYSNPPTTYNFDLNTKYFTCICFCELFQRFNVFEISKRIYEKYVIFIFVC